MGAEIDRLDLQIEAQATKANSALDNLVGKLERVSGALSKLDTKGIQKFSSGIQLLSNGMQGLSNVKLPDYNRVVKGINKFSEIDANKLSSVSSALMPLASGIKVLGSSNFDNKNIQSLINSLTQLSNSNIGNFANIDFTSIGNSILNLTNSLAGAEKVNQSTISMTNAIANLSKFAGNMGTVSTELPRLGVVLNDFITTMSGAANISDRTIAFTSAIGQLASSGNKASQTASNLEFLAAELKKFIQTMSTVPNVNTNVIQLINSLGNLASQGRRVTTASNNASRAINRYSLSSIGAAKSGMRLSSILGKIYQKYFWISRIVKRVGSAINSSMNYIEEYNYYNVTLGKIGKEWSSQFEQFGYENAESYAKSFESRMNELSAKMTGFNINADGTLTNNGLDNLGLDVTKMMNYQAGLAQVTNAQGLTGEASIATSKALSMLAGDMSSFRNTDLSTVMTNFQSGIIGQSRALYKYGIDITNASLKTYAYANGIDKAVSEMTQGEKMQLRTLAIIDQSKVAWGDLANTIESPANQLRLLKNNFSALGRTIGNVFIPTVANVLPYINGLVIAIRRLFEWCGKMLNIDLSKIIEKSGTGYSDAFDSIIDDSEDMSDNLDNAKNSAKELKNELMGFDEINKLSDTSDSSSSGSDTSGAGTIDLTSQLNKALADYEKVWNEAFDNMNNKANDFADNIVEVFKSGDFESIGAAVADGINSIVHSALTIGENFDWPEFGTSLASIINGFFDNFDFGALADSIDAWIQGLASAIIAFIKEFDFASVLKGAWDFLSHIDIETIGLVISGITFHATAKVISTAVTTKLLPILTDWFAKNSAKFLKVGIAITVAVISIEFAESELDPIFSEYDLDEIKAASEAMFNDWFGNNPISATLSDMFVFTATTIAEPSEIMDGLSLLWDDVCSGDFKFNLGNLFEFPSYNEVEAWLGDTGSAISDWWNTNIAIWFNGDTWKELWGYVCEDFQEGWQEIKDWWNSIAIVRWWNDDVAIWFNGDTWKELWGYVKEDFEEGWQNVKDWWKDNALSKWWDEHVSPYFTKEKWNLSGIKDGLEESFNAAIDGIKGIWNGFASWINEALKLDFDGFSKSFSVMGKKIEIGIPEFNVTLGHIPTFATGGFPEDGWFRASHGEMMGKFDDGQSVVANNNQITDGI